MVSQQNTTIPGSAAARQHSRDRSSVRPYGRQRIHPGVALLPLHRVSCPVSPALTELGSSGGDAVSSLFHENSLRGQSGARAALHERLGADALVITASAKRVLPLRFYRQQAPPWCFARFAPPFYRQSLHHTVAGRSAQYPGTYSVGVRSPSRLAVSCERESPAGEYPPLWNRPTLVFRSRSASKKPRARKILWNPATRGH